MPIATKDYYTVLELPRSATRDEIKRAYRRKALACHPDRGGSPVRMKALNEAWAVLGDAEARREYDAQRRLNESDVPRVVVSAKRQAPQTQAAPRESGHPLTTALFSVLKPLAFRLGRALNRLREFFRGWFKRK